MQSKVRFSKVPKKLAEKVWETLVQSPLRFNRVSDKFPEEVWEALVQNQVRFNRVPGEGSGEGLGCFGAEPCHKVREKDLQKVPEDLGAARFNGSGMIPGECRRSS